MPNHIHLIVEINQKENDNLFNKGCSGICDIGGTSRTPSPTNAILPSFVSTLKRFMNKEIGFSIFQRSYHDHIIRNEKEYLELWKYIDNNPYNWENDCFYTKK